ncbi:Nif3-like dinuclear metal center hexameric protein [Blastopirellula sp. JC732]|uniref:GTP cyclohydrolase 1 type 2 homolog n=1 Tax=Blastopirellula sediminis TaxID=2894196 RepID=A0A9X1MMV4_9BACT|nr:Nif3-like dinuclear metal center hexameric protein [Blastopirellula sediminis]MCC9606650.1 Nif3-like dinuclear metal center hexameric protein [Blastopirellula sediminis]MCC9630053.1 Nif3-like dinuclear metal center hexameric protein [Blastopirellula sediminis]
MTRSNSLTVDQICRYLDQFAPTALAESWDNVGLLVGDRAASVEKLMTCLTITPEVVDEALDQGADAIVAHHPLPFRALKRITADDTVGRMLLRLIAAGVAIYSPHTGFDSAAAGINQQLAIGLGFTEIAPLKPADNPSLAPLGSGRYGKLAAPLTLAKFAAVVREFLKIDYIQAVGDPEQTIAQPAVACGAAGEFLSTAITLSCDCLLLGETNFHTSLEAKAHGVALVLVGHYASERFAVETLASQLATDFPDLKCWASERETDPITLLS